METGDWVSKLEESKVSSFSSLTDLAVVANASRIDMCSGEMVKNEGLDSSVGRDDQGSDSESLGIEYSISSISSSLCFWISAHKRQGRTFSVNPATDSNPWTCFGSKVSRIGNTALLRSSGCSFAHDTIHLPSAN